MTQVVKIPDASHPITVEPTAGRVTVRVNGQQIAQTTRALSLAEARYPVVQYVPIDDVDPSVLRRTETTSYCPYKGVASYYSVQTADGATSTDVIWAYETPHDAVAPIAGHVAFYPDRAEITIDEG